MLDEAVPSTACTKYSNSSRLQSSARQHFGRITYTAMFKYFKWSELKVIHLEMERMYVHLQANGPASNQYSYWEIAKPGFIFCLYVLLCMFFTAAGLTCC